MKNTLTLGTFLLGCCLVAVGQTSSSQYGSSSSDQAGQQPGYSGQTSSSQSEQSGSMSTNQGESNQANKTSLRGCLTQAADGKFMLSDFSGNSYQLTGETASLGKFVGNEVRVDGSQISGGQPGAMSSTQGQAGGQAQQEFNVSKVHKIASTCRGVSGANPSSTKPSGGSY